MRDGYYFTTERYPLLILETSGGAVADEIFEDYLRRLDLENDRAVDQGDLISLLIDTSGARAGATANQRRMQADWLKRNYGRLETNTAGVALVITSPLLRGVLTAILWLQRMPCPYVTFATREKAEKWCYSLLYDDHGKPRKAAAQS